MDKITSEYALELGRKTIHREIETLQSLEAELGEPFWECTQLLIDCRGLIWITGVGTSASVGERFAHNLTCSGARAMFLSPSLGLHGHTGIFRKKDILIALSRGGESQEVNQMVEIANEHQVITIGFVHNTSSSLAKNCRYILPIKSPQEFELIGYLATTSTVAYSAMCDALCAVVIHEKRITPETFARIHPGGAVGKALNAPGSLDELEDLNA